MRIRQLQTFCDLAETLNYTRTAERLHYAQSSVMEQVQALEDHFGVPLIEREGRQLRLTAAGEQVRAEAGRIVRLAQEMRERVRAHDGGAALSVLAPETFCVRRLPAVMHAWRAAWPEVQVTAGPASRVVLASAVEEGKADVVVMLGVPGTPPGLHAGGPGLDIVGPGAGPGRPGQSGGVAGAVHPGASAAVAPVNTIFLASEELLLVARAGHPLERAAGGMQRDALLRALADYPLYASEPGCAYRAASDAVLQPLGYVPTLVCGSVAAVVESVAATDGVALLPRMAVEGDLDRRLCVIGASAAPQRGTGAAAGGDCGAAASDDRRSVAGAGHRATASGDCGAEGSVERGAAASGGMHWPRVPIVMRWRADDARPHVAAFAAAACALT